MISKHWSEQARLAHPQARQGLARLKSWSASNVMRPTEASDEREPRRKGMAHGQGSVAQKLRRGGGSETLPTVFRGMGEWIAAWIVPLPGVRPR